MANFKVRQLNQARLASGGEAGPAVPDYARLQLAVPS